MIIISHRGAAGLAPENTIEGIEVARKHNVDYIEVDVHTTEDKKLVLAHDDGLGRISSTTDKISRSKLLKINTTQTYSGHPIPTLDEAFEAAGKTPLLIDCKGNNWPEVLAKKLASHKGLSPIVACDNVSDLVIFRELSPKIEIFYSELTKPYEAIQTAKALKFSGVCLQYSLYSPLVYFMAKRSNLKMTMFTVNKTSLARFLHLFYPKVMITTDFPDRFKK